MLPKPILALIDHHQLNVMLLPYKYKRVGLIYASTLVIFSFEPGINSFNPMDNEHSSLSPDHSLSPVNSRSSSPYTIYLTFDDGPCPGSEKVNELARKDSLFINAFLIGKNVYGTNKGRPLWQEYRDNPFVELGNHSYTHAERHYLRYFREPATVLADFNRNRDSLRFNNNFVRLPGRNFFRVDSLRRNDISTGKAAADTLAANGYTVFGWDVEWRNKANKGIHLHTGQEMLEITDRMLRERKTFFPDRIVILIHDPELQDSGFTSDLEDFIHRAKADGRFRFEHLSGYP
jgi:peptidoglycan/xylan/chitin deacetylase (PgdA/CDA1 family)